MNIDNLFALWVDLFLYIIIPIFAVVIFINHLRRQKDIKKSFTESDKLIEYAKQNEEALKKSIANSDKAIANSEEEIKILREIRDLLKNK